VQHGHPCGAIKVIALITETAQAVLSGSTFTTPPARVIGYTWGAEDLAADVGASTNRTAAAISNSRSGWRARPAC